MDEDKLVRMVALMAAALAVSGSLSSAGANPVLPRAVEFEQYILGKKKP